MFQWGIYGLGALCLLSACHKTVQNETVNTPVQVVAHVTDARAGRPEMRHLARQVSRNTAPNTLGARAFMAGVSCTSAE